ncbi:uncharacterized protein TrAtP1_013034 [Trichoderma atroviride]|uniref:uncharacterized protein n=1 Tax=Hypocrea atroviridis TaxID=63577 RepID=UPI00332285CD|nr:hypothetical protein TrAtP1_013034 [Trichoderma atroviride]
MEVYFRRPWARHALSHLSSSSPPSPSPSQHSSHKPETSTTISSADSHAPPNVQDFCSASNIHSGCENGRFYSGAMDTCRECHC